MTSPEEIKNLIKTFEKIRDIPYHCPESIHEEDHRCWGKNRLLANELKKQGYDVRFRVCQFTWSKQKLPEEIISQAPANIDYHPFLEIKLNSKWVIVDATLDNKFSKYNEWDGISDTKILIKYDEILSVEESEENEKKENFRERNKEWFEFCRKLNKFFEGIRG